GGGGGREALLARLGRRLGGVRLGRSQHEEGQRLQIEVGDDVAEHVQVGRLRVALDELEDGHERQAGNAGVQQRQDQVRERERTSEEAGDERQSEGATDRCTEQSGAGGSKGGSTVREHKRDDQRRKEGQGLGTEIGGVEASSEENSTTERVREQEHPELGVRSSNGLLSLDRVVSVEGQGDQRRQREEQTSKEEMDEAAEDVGAHKESDRRAQRQHRSPEERRTHRRWGRLHVALVLYNILNRRLERLRLRRSRGNLLLHQLLDLGGAKPESPGVGGELALVLIAESHGVGIASLEYGRVDVSWSSCVSHFCEAKGRRRRGEVKR
ncbi:hypothetical protein PMAYCL1PPCAC_00666, partial [Pristionchus mayeri]